MILNCDDCYGSLTVNGVLLARANTCLPDLSDLWMGPEGRGENTLIPHKAGRKAESGIADQTRYSLPWLVSGQADDVGNELPSSAWADAMEATWSALYAAVVFPTVSGASETVPIVWALPSGAIRTSDGQVGRPAALRLEAGSILRTTLELTVPAGDLYV